MLNIEFDVEVNIEELEQRPLLEFYGFYEVNSEKIFILTFEDQIRYDIEYFALMNTIFSLKFPFTANGENEFNI